MPDYTLPELPGEVSQARQTAERAETSASDFSAASMTVTDQLRKTINDALKQNKELYDIRSTSLANFLASPEIAEAKYAVKDKPDYIFNPFERNKAIAEYVKGEEIPFLTANAMLGQVVGGGERLIESGTRAFQAQTIATQAASTAARQAYTDVLNEFMMKENIRSGRASEELSREQFAFQKAQAGRAGSGEEKQDPFKVNAEVVDIVASADATLKGIVESGRDVTKADIDQIFNALQPQFDRVDIGPDEVNAWKQTAYEEYNTTDVVEPSGDGGGVKGFFRGLESKLSNKLFPPSVAPSQVDLSNLNRGVSNVETFLSGFDFGQEPGGSAQLRR